jgi:hypothetical protein
MYKPRTPSHNRDQVEWEQTHTQGHIFIVRLCMGYVPSPYEREFSLEFVMGLGNV